MVSVVKGFQFNATLQLRTPLRVLSRHGEMHAARAGSPPVIAKEQWEGIWLPVTKSLEELTGSRGRVDAGAQFYRSLDMAFAQPTKHASDIGPVLPEAYLPFLVAVRKIVEAKKPISVRIAELRGANFPTQWTVFVRKHGGKGGLIDKFFPYFMNLGPRLNTPNSIAAAPDADLLAIKGVGPAKLAAIRQHCASFVGDRDSDRIDAVRT